MELQSLNKEYRLLRAENTDKFIKLHEVDPAMVMVEEFWITSDHTMGNRCAYFDSFSQAEEYANLLADNRSKLNENKEKPFSVFLNGKEVKVKGYLGDFLAGKFEI